MILDYCGQVSHNLYQRSLSTFAANASIGSKKISAEAATRLISHSN